jgi:hypothetical protein
MKQIHLTLKTAVQNRRENRQDKNRRKNHRQTDISIQSVHHTEA